MAKKMVEDVYDREHIQEELIQDLLGKEDLMNKQGKLDKKLKIDIESTETAGKKTFC